MFKVLEVNVGIEISDLLKKISVLATKASDTYNGIGIDGKKKQLEKLESMTYTDGFWNDKENSAQVNKEISILKKKVDPWEQIITDIKDAKELLEVAAEEGDANLIEEITEQLKHFEERFENLENLELLSGEDDLNNAFITVHAGAGGTESQDWALMLLRMYIRWAEKSGYDAETIDYMAGEEAGIKQATVLIKGDYAYGLLNCEAGVHRLVRISPFDSNKRRHTSFASVEVHPEISEDIDIDIVEADLRIDTYRASGAGGQHVNTTDSAVRITHIPSGIVVSCQNERSQHKNKASAMKVLKSKLYEKQKIEMQERIDEKAGEKKDIAWGSQIRSYVFQPYTMVKDHRTGEETGSVEYVLDGDITKFIYAYLRFKNTQKSE
ncbi:MAG TPA: peptide chain release factor 2 [Spirochaetota bacterium]|nr:peptide chain release factor 2 [Spirochaetota bacterium]